MNKIDTEPGAGNFTEDEPDAKATIGLRVAWVLTLDKRDSLLVLKALGGRLKSDAEIKAASELCDRLTKQRATEAGQLADHLRRHAANITGEME